MNIGIDVREALESDPKAKKLYETMKALAVKVPMTQFTPVRRYQEGFRLQPGELIYSHRLLSDYTGMPLKTVARKRDKLVRLGLIRVYSYPDRGLPSIVTVYPDVD